MTGAPYCRLGSEALALTQRAVTKHAAAVSGAESLNDRDGKRSGAAALDELRDRVLAGFVGNGFGHRRGQPKRAR